MSLLPNRKSSRFVLGSGALLLALSLYSSAVSLSSQNGSVSAEGGTYLNAARSTVIRARRDWRTLRWNLRNLPQVPAQQEAREKMVETLTLRSARLTADHLEVSYAIPEAECVSLWMTAAGNQKFQRLNVIGGVPCSLDSGELSLRLRLGSIQPVVAEGQLVQLCTNAGQECSQPVAIASDGNGSHTAAQEAITIHSATIARNAYLSVTYSKGEGCVAIVRWNGPTETQNVSYDDEPFTCDAVDHGTARVNIRGMQPLLGATQWIYLCTENDATHCSNAYRIR